MVADGGEARVGWAMDSVGDGNDSGALKGSGRC